jgi:hypothetical protein
VVTTFGSFGGAVVIADNHAESGAEVVVCETAERFVPRPPAVRLAVADLVRTALAFS